MNRVSFLEFHSNLHGFDCYRNGRLTPKYVLYWSGLDSERILLGRTKIKIQKRKFIRNTK